MTLRGADKVKAAMGRLKESQNDNIRGVYLAGLKNIVQETPVDKGRARNNWFLSVDSPVQAINIMQSKDGVDSIYEATKMPKDVLGKIIYFTNNLPYIKTLEYGGYPKNVKNGTYIKSQKDYQKLSKNGYSLQAPKGWVRSTIKKMRRKIKKL